MRSRPSYRRKLSVYSINFFPDSLLLFLPLRNGAVDGVLPFSHKTSRYACFMFTFRYIVP